MVFQKEQLRAHCVSIDDEPRVNSEKRMEVGNENREDDERDRISELPDLVLLHIMNLMDTKSAVRTCVLSKRFKDLCKQLSNLKFHAKGRWDINFGKFVSWVLSNRDDSYSLLNLDIDCWAEPEHVGNIIRYAVFHNVQHLTMESCFGLSCQLLPLLFGCRSLTSLKLCIKHPSHKILPKSLHLPALRSLYLAFLQFTGSDNDCGCAEPFSNCQVLNTLVLGSCSLYNDQQVLCISNSTLCDLTVKTEDLKIVLSTPNLNSFTVNGFLGSQLSTTCNLSCLEDVKFDLCLGGCSDFMTWLQVLANVKILTISSRTLQLHDLVCPTSMMPQLPCFVRLESIKVSNHYVYMTDQIVDKVVNYLLRNTPMAGVDIIING